jgi:hypothetical protein
MEDLERLADQEYWDEVIAHLDDIKALDRDDRWQTVLETSVVGWMESLVNKDDTEKAYLDSTDVFNRFKTLKKSDEAMKLKEKVGMRQVEACLRFQDPETKRLKDCRPISKEFIGYHKGRKAELAVKVANLTSYQRNARWAAQYYQMALEAKMAMMSCAQTTACRWLFTVDSTEWTKKKRWPTTCGKPAQST